MTKSPNKKIRVMIVDDHFVVRMGLSGSINLEPDMTVDTEATTADRAIALYRQHKPDVVLMDLKLPDLSGTEATRTICQESPDARIIMLSTHDGEEDIYRSFQAGARAYLVKTAEREQLIGTIRAVQAGERCVPPAVASRLAQRMGRPDLTARELEVLELIIKGRSNKEIAADLSIAEVTVKLHVGHILEKLGVKDRTQAATTALQRGIVHLD